MTAAFQDFLRSFKTPQASVEELDLNGDGTSDEYDFMDDAELGNGQSHNRRSDARSTVKYMDLLQQVSDRKRTHVTIELDDLALVRRKCAAAWHLEDANVVVAV